MYVHTYYVSIVVDSDLKVNILHIAIKIIVN